MWKDRQRLLLLDSILRGLPIGSVMVWRTLGPSLRQALLLPPGDHPASRTIAGALRWRAEQLHALEGDFLSTLGLTLGEEDEAEVEDIE